MTKRISDKCHGGTHVWHPYVCHMLLNTLNFKSASGPNQYVITRQKTPAFRLSRPALRRAQLRCHSSLSSLSNLARCVPPTAHIASTTFDETSTYGACDYSPCGRFQHSTTTKKPPRRDIPAFGVRSTISSLVIPAEATRIAHPCVGAVHSAALLALPKIKTRQRVIFAESVLKTRLSRKIISNCLVPSAAVKLRKYSTASSHTNGVVNLFFPAPG